MQFLIDLVLILVYSGIILLLSIWIWRFWMMYVNQKHLNKVNADSIMLEIKLPREINKSPAAIESVMHVFLQTGGVGSWHHRNWQGNLPTVTSLEIASLEGVIHFYIRTQKKFKELIMSSLYAQYPGIEIMLVDDYTKLIHYHHLSKDVKLWGATFKTSKKWTITDEKTGKPYAEDKGSYRESQKDDYEMPADFYPIKTYIDYELDKNPKEEFKNDPMVPMLEFMGSVGKGEYVWYQVLLQDEGTFNDKKFPKTYFNKITKKTMNLADMVKERKTQMRSAGKILKGTVAEDEYGHVKQKPTGKKDAAGNNILEDITYKKDVSLSKKEMELTMEDKEEIETISKKIEKPLARTIIRLLYISKEESWNAAHIQNVLNSRMPFNGWNSFMPMVSDPYDFPWQNFRGHRVPWRSEEKFTAFVEREGFHPYAKTRESLDKFEDSFFWSYSMRTRKLFRIIFEIIFNPFERPTPREMMVLNAEEVATLYHFPGQVASIPTLPRIDSTKGVAPSNLPQ